MISWPMFSLVIKQLGEINQLYLDIRGHCLLNFAVFCLFPLCYFNLLKKKKIVDIQKFCAT